MLVTNKKFDLDHFKVSSTNSEIKRNKCIKYLRVLIDDKLCWKNDINYTCSKFLKVVGHCLVSKIFCHQNS